MDPIVNPRTYNFIIYCYIFFMFSVNRDEYKFLYPSGFRFIDLVQFLNKFQDYIKQGCLRVSL